MLLAIGAFVALIVTVAAVDRFQQDEHPPTEVAGLIWQVRTAFNRIQDLEATLQVTDESHPAESVRMKLRYVKGPPSVLSMRHVPPQAAGENLFTSSVRDETFTIENDRLFHYIPSEDIIVSKRWPGVPLVMIGLGIFDISQLRSDWLNGEADIRILQDISGFTGLPFETSITDLYSFSHSPAIPFDLFSIHELQLLQSYSLWFSFCPELQDGGSQLSLGLAQSFDAETGNSIRGSHILEVRNSDTKELLRMIWIDRETYLVQKVVTFKNGQKGAAILVQLITINQGLTEDDVITPSDVEGFPLPQPGVENIRG